MQRALPHASHAGITACSSKFYQILNFQARLLASGELPSSAKKVEIERPIGLCDVVYKAWLQVRYSLVSAWLTKYVEKPSGMRQNPATLALVSQFTVFSKRRLPKRTNSVELRSFWISQHFMRPFPMRDWSNQLRSWSTQLPCSTLLSRSIEERESSQRTQVILLPPMLRKGW